MSKRLVRFSPRCDIGPFDPSAGICLEFKCSHRLNVPIPATTNGQRILIATIPAPDKIFLHQHVIYADDQTWLDEELAKTMLIQITRYLQKIPIPALPLNRWFLLRLEDQARRWLDHHIHQDP